MKRILLCACLFALGASYSHAQSWVVTEKRGKVTMEKAYFADLKSKAAKYDSLQDEITRLQNDLAQEKNKANQRASIITFNDSASYAIGRDLHDSWSRQQLRLNIDVVIQSLKDCRHGQNTWDEKTLRNILQRFQQQFEERERAKQQAAMGKAKDNIAAGEKFLAKNKESKAVFTTPSGLQYRILQKGNGKKPKATDRVKVHYKGTLIDGTQFDSSYDRGEPIVFSPNQVIRGWGEGLQLMEEGGKYILYVPYNLGYGEQMVGSIPPGSTLIFEMEILEINPKQ